MQRPKEGSRKALVWDAFQAGGLADAVAKGKALGLADGTTKSWCGAWGKGGEARPAAPKGTPAAETAETAEFAPDYRYPSAAKATRAAVDKIRLNRMHASCLGVVKGGDKFAIVPRHLLPDAKPDVFAKGARVADRTDPRRVGVVKGYGPEQCEVQFEGSMVQAVSTIYLMAVDAPAPVAKGKRARRAA